MKIVHIVAGIQETCGISQYVVNTSRAQGLAGHDVTIITAMTCGYPVSDLKVVLTPDSVSGLKKVVVEGSDDVIVHIHSMWGMYIHHAAVWCRKNKIAYVVSPHGSATPWAMRYKRLKKFIAWWLYQRSDFRQSAGFHVTAIEEENDVRRLGFRQPVVIAPLGADVADSGCSISQAHSIFQANSRDVVFLSRIHPKKNVGSLLRAWALVREGLGVRGQGLGGGGHHCPPPPTFSTYTPRLIIAGSNDVGHQEELVELAQSLGLKVVDFSRDLEFGKKQVYGGGEVPVATFQKRLKDCHSDVVFTGPVYSSAKDWMFGHAWVSVLPSYSENFGGVVVEALAQGTPVIASTGTPWRVLEERGCGWWVNPTPENIADAITAALEMSTAERMAIAERARHFVMECYSWESSATKVLKLYEEVRRVWGGYVPVAGSFG